MVRNYKTEFELPFLSENQLQKVKPYEEIVVYYNCQTVTVFRQKEGSFFRLQFDHDVLDVVFSERQKTLFVLFGASIRTVHTDTLQEFFLEAPVFYDRFLGSALVVSRDHEVAFLSSAVESPTVLTTDSLCFPVRCANCARTDLLLLYRTDKKELQLHVFAKDGKTEQSTTVSFGESLFEKLSVDNVVFFHKGTSAQDVFLFVSTKNKLSVFSVAVFFPTSSDVVRRATLLFREGCVAAVPFHEFVEQGLALAVTWIKVTTFVQLCSFSNELLRLGSCTDFLAVRADGTKNTLVLYSGTFLLEKLVFDFGEEVWKLVFFALLVKTQSLTFAVNNSAALFANTSFVSAAVLVLKPLTGIDSLLQRESNVRLLSSLRTVCVLHSYFSFGNVSETFALFAAVHSLFNYRTDSVVAFDSHSVDSLGLGALFPFSLFKLLLCARDHVALLNPVFLASQLDLSFALERPSRRSANKSGSGTLPRYTDTDSVFVGSGFPRVVQKFFSSERPFLFRSKGDIDVTLGRKEAARQLQSVLMLQVLKRLCLVFGRTVLSVLLMRSKTNCVAEPISCQAEVHPENFKFGLLSDELASVLQQFQLFHLASVFLLGKTKTDRKTTAEQVTAAKVFSEGLLGVPSLLTGPQLLASLWTSSETEKCVLLVGLAAAQLATARSNLARVLLTNVPAYYKPVAKNLAVENELTFSSFLALGLLFFATANPTLLAFLKSELFSGDASGDPVYFLWVGFSLGLLSFQKGHRLMQTQSGKAFLLGLFHAAARDDLVPNRLPTDASAVVPVRKEPGLTLSGTFVVLALVFFVSDREDVAAQMRALYSGDSLELASLFAYCYFVVVPAKLGSRTAFERLFVFRKHTGEPDLVLLGEHVGTLLALAVVFFGSNDKTLKRRLVELLAFYKSLLVSDEYFESVVQLEVETLLAALLLALAAVAHADAAVLQLVTADVLLFWKDFVLSDNNTFVFLSFALAFLHAGTGPLSDKQKAFLFLSLFPFPGWQNRDSLTSNIVRLLAAKAFRRSRSEKTASRRTGDDAAIFRSLTRNNSCNKRFLQTLKKKLVDDSWFFTNPYNEVSCFCFRKHSDQVSGNEVVRSFLLAANRTTPSNLSSLFELYEDFMKTDLFDTGVSFEDFHETCVGFLKQ